MLVKDIIEEIFPPDVPAITRWRLMMFVFCMAVTFHIAWACGLIPGQHGFASASDVRTIAEKVDLILKLQVESRLRSLQQEKCLARSPTLRSALQYEIDRLQHDHKLLDGNYYPMPSCRLYTVEGVQGTLNQSKNEEP